MVVVVAATFLLASCHIMAYAAGTRPVRPAARPVPEPPSREQLVRLRKVLRSESPSFEHWDIPSSLSTAAVGFAWKDPESAIKLLDDTKAEVESPEVGWNQARQFLVRSVLKEVFADRFLWRNEEAPTWAGMRTVANAAIADVRELVANARLPLETRIEASRLLAVCGLPGGAADYAKLTFQQNPPEENSVQRNDGSTWQGWSEKDKAVFLTGFMTANGADYMIAGAGTTLTQRVGAYVIELNVFYEKSGNLRVSLTEAVFRAQDSLAQR
jgi:hypothetical protein